MQTLTPNKLPFAVRNHLRKYDFNLCLTCGACSSGCPITGTPGMEGWDTRKVIRMIAMGLLDEVVASDFPWVCTGCGRCAHACPMNIDIVPIMAHMKHLRPRPQVPTILRKGVERVMESGNNMSISMEDYLGVMSDVGGELADEECPGFYVPVDRQGADILFFPNSKEVYGDFEDMKWWWKIFYAARENWTVPSHNWEAVDWGLFSANYEVTRVLAQRKIDLMRDLKIKRMIMPDCGGGSYGCRVGMRYCSVDDPSNKVNYAYLYEYLKELLESGSVNIDKSVNAGKRFTWHDSCKHGRELIRHFGFGYFEEPRWIINQCVDEFVEMPCSRENNFCCGAGGGNWPMPYEKESAAHGRFKADQIRHTKADVVVVGCSNCRDQIMRRLPKYYPDLKYEVKYLWQLVAESLVFEPLEGEALALAEAAAKAQWNSFGIEVEDAE